MDQVKNSSRRAFLAATAVGVAGYSSLAISLPRASGLSVSGEPKLLVRGQQLNFDEVTIDTFKDLLGSRFILRDAEGLRMQTELTEVTELALNPADDRPTQFRKPFSLIFRLTDGRQLPQSTCHVGHQQLGQFDLFLVPLSVSAGALNVQAIFA